MDAHTFKRLKKRDETAFIDMMSEHKQTIYYTAITYLKSSDKALEAVQEVTFRAYKYIHKVKKPEAIKAWLTRITINYCLDEIKKGKRVQGDEGYIEQQTVSFDPSTSLLITEAIHKLSPKYQTIIIMKYQQELTLTEIADSLDIPIGTVKTYLNRSLKQLRVYMERGGLNPNEFQA